MRSGGPIGRFGAGARPRPRLAVRSEREIQLIAQLEEAQHLGPSEEPHNPAIVHDRH
jgi:hypothetical protein